MQWQLQVLLDYLRPAVIWGIQHKNINWSLVPVIVPCAVAAWKRSNVKHPMGLNQISAKIFIWEGHQKRRPALPWQQQHGWPSLDPPQDARSTTSPPLQLEIESQLTFWRAGSIPASFTFFSSCHSWFLKTGFCPPLPPPQGQPLPENLQQGFSKVTCLLLQSETRSHFKVDIGWHFGLSTISAGHFSLIHMSKVFMRRRVRNQVVQMKDYLLMHHLQLHNWNLTTIEEQLKYAMQCY